MKPIIQILPLQPNTSFVASRFTTPYLETGLHQHAAYELILITEGNGQVGIGNFNGQYTSWDIYLLGSLLPHQFTPTSNSVTSAIVIHFMDDCWGKDFLQMPECWLMKQLLAIASYGLQITGETKRQLQPLIKALETATDGNRIILLLQCLQIVASAKEYTTLTISNVPEPNKSDLDCIDRILKYTIEAFRDPLTIPKVAAVACMSVPSFCNYFKRRTQKTYINYLNEVRVSYACNQLIATNKPVTDIGYESGYNTVGHFHRQFLRLKKTTPLQYRKMKSERQAQINYYGDLTKRTSQYTNF